MVRKKRSRKVSTPSSERCSFSKCQRGAVVIVMIDGFQYPLCDRHMRFIQRKLDSIVRKKGVASLDMLGVKTRRGKITQVFVKPSS